MMCLTDEQMELLMRNRAGWFRAWLWELHVKGCKECKSNLESFKEREGFLIELRRLPIARNKP